MSELLALLLPVLRAALRDRSELLTEHLLLRHQLAVRTRHVASLLPGRQDWNVCSSRPAELEPIEMSAKFSLGPGRQRNSKWC